MRMKKLVMTLFLGTGIILATPLGAEAGTGYRTVGQKRAEKRRSDLRRTRWYERQYNRSFKKLMKSNPSLREELKILERDNGTRSRRWRAWLRGSAAVVGMTAVPLLSVAPDMIAQGVLLGVAATGVLSAVELDREFKNVRKMKKDNRKKIVGLALQQGRWVDPLLRQLLK